MRFFADHCVAESVCQALEGGGHEVIRLRDELPPDSPDPVVARYAEKRDAVLVTHDSDFRRIAPRIPVGAKQRFRRLSRIQLHCDYPRASERMTAALSLIEFEWKLARKRRDRRIHIVIRKTAITTNR